MEEQPLRCVPFLGHPLCTRPAQVFALTIFRDSQIHIVDRGGIERTRCVDDMPCILAESNADPPQAIQGQLLICIAIHLPPIEKRCRCHTLLPANVQAQFYSRESRHAEGLKRTIVQTKDGCRSVPRGASMLPPCSVPWPLLNNNHLHRLNHSNLLSAASHMRTQENVELTICISFKLLYFTSSWRENSLPFCCINIVYCCKEKENAGQRGIWTKKFKGQGVALALVEKISHCRSQGG